MRKNILKNTLVFTIIILFIGTSLVSAIDINYETEIDTKEISTLSIKDGLVGYWSFDYENAEDESGNNNIGTIHGPIPLDGISGRAFIYDGIDDYIHIQSSLTLEMEDEITISSWIYPVGYNYWGRIYHKGGPAGNRIIDTALSEDNHLKFRINRDTVTPFGFVKSDREIDLNEWTFVTFYYNRNIGQMRIYINGELDANSTYSENIHTGYYNHFIGNWGADGARPFFGTIDEVRIYNKALSEDEILYLYNNPRGLKSTIMFGRISNVNTDVGNLITFDAIRTRCIQFSPFKFLTFKSEEKIKISEEYFGVLNQNIILGSFKSNI
jgi:hypothetical protein